MKKLIVSLFLIGTMLLVCFPISGIAESPVSTGIEACAHGGYMVGSTYWLDTRTMYVPYNPEHHQQYSVQYGICSECQQLVPTGHYIIGNENHYWINGTCLLCSGEASKMIESQEAIQVNLYYYNPEGGSYYHSDKACNTIHPGHFPLKEISGHELSGTGYSLLKPCPVCVEQTKY